MSAVLLAGTWYERFNKFAADLYPGRYTREFCLELAEQAIEIQKLAEKKGSYVVAHNYLYPEFHHVAKFIGDSLLLAHKVRASGTPRVDFAAVYFMGATGKITLGDAARVFVSDTPEVLGCSLVSGTDYAHVERWKEQNPGGVLVTYINSSVYLKSISKYICTSGNAEKMILRAVRENPGAKVYVLPDKFLGFVMKAKALDVMDAEMRRDGADDQQVMKMRKEMDERIEVYKHSYAGNHASCYSQRKTKPQIS